MLRFGGFHILGLTLACLGAAAWARAFDFGSDLARWSAVALWLSAAACAVLESKSRRRARAGVVLQLRQAAAQIRPADARFDPISIDADSFGAAVDGLIAASRVQGLTLETNVRELELMLKATCLERDRAQAMVSELVAAVGATRVDQDASSLASPAAGREAEPSRLRRDFVSLLSHNFRTPLASIKAYSEMLIDGEATDIRSQREFIDIIHAEADRLSQSIDNVLVVARLDAGVAEADLKPTPLAPIIEAALREVAPSARTRQVELLSETTTADLPIRADGQSLTQALANLLENAVRLSPEGGVVRVEAAWDQLRGVVAIRIEDSGPGIDPDLFDRPIRDMADGDQGLPLGSLGLSVAKRVVETVHRGRLRAERRAQQGSRFTIELPSHVRKPGEEKAPCVLAVSENRVAV